MGVFESVLQFLGSSVCHQLAERSYFFGDVQMPLCARCIGIHFGFFLSTAYLLLGTRRYASKLPSVRQMAVLGAVMVFYLIDAGLSYSGISESDNLRRTMSGLALGVPLPFILVPLLNSVAFSGRNGSNPLSNAKGWTAVPVLYVTGLGAILAAESNGPLFYVVSFVGVTGVFVFFTTAISIVLFLAFEKSQLATRYKLISAAAIAVLVLLLLAVLHDSFFPT